MTEGQQTQADGLRASGEQSEERQLAQFYELCHVVERNPFLVDFYAQALRRIRTEGPSNVEPAEPSAQSVPSEAAKLVIFFSIFAPEHPEFEAYRDENPSAVEAVLDTSQDPEHQYSDVHTDSDLSPTGVRRTMVTKGRSMRIDGITLAPDESDADGAFTVETLPADYPSDDVPDLTMTEAAVLSVLTDGTAYRMEQLKEIIPELGYVSPAVYKEFKRNFSYTRELILAHSRRQGKEAAWVVSGQARGIRYRLVTSEDESLQQETTTDVSTGVVGAPTLVRSEDSVPRPRPERLTRTLPPAEFAQQLLDAITAQTQSEDPMDAHVNKLPVYVANELGVSLEVSKAMIQSYRDAGQLFKRGKGGNRYFTVDPLEARSKRASSAEAKKERAKKELESLGDEELRSAISVLDLMTFSRWDLTQRRTSKSLRNELAPDMNDKGFTLMLRKLAARGYVELEDAGDYRKPRTGHIVYLTVPDPRPRWKNKREVCIRELALPVDTEA